MTLPTADGSANQVLKTDGSGALSWTTINSGATSINGLTDALVEDNSIYIVTHPHQQHIAQRSSRKNSFKCCHNRRQQCCYWKSYDFSHYRSIKCCNGYNALETILQVVKISL